MPRYKKSRLTERLLELIPFDDWIEADVIFDKIIPQVAPGIALRRYNQNYDKYRLTVDNPQMPPQRLEGNAAIRSGARDIINHLLVALRREGYILSEGRGKNRRLKQIEHRMFDGKYCCLHGGSCGGKIESAAVEQPDNIDWETPWTW